MSRRERKKLIRRKLYKRMSNRKLSSRDIGVLNFLWTWKVASTPMLKEAAFKDKSHWWTYKALRQLRQERYIELLPRGAHLDLELWTLTAQGFEVVLMDRDDMKELRYRVHAPAHDYLATCLQLGDVWPVQSKLKCHFFTEQMLASLSPMNFPTAWRREMPEHVPDGISVFQAPINELVIGYEVDLNLKDKERYESTLKYYSEAIKPNFVVWLVRKSLLGFLALGLRSWKHSC